MKERKTQRKTKAELKEMIIELLVQNARLQIPDGHCPYVYAKLKNAPVIDCGTESCIACKQQFFELKRKEITETVNKY